MTHLASPSSFLASRRRLFAALLASTGTRANDPLLAMRRPGRTGARDPDIPVAPASMTMPPDGVRWLTRGTFGFTIPDLIAFNALGADDASRWQAWIARQLAPSSIDDSACDARIASAGFVTLGKTENQLWTDHHSVGDDYYVRMLPVAGLAPVDEGHLLFWIATRRISPGEPPEPNPIPGLLERHRGWVPEIAEVIEATPPQAVMRHELFDRKPTKRWVSGRIALLGDAAHPMLPFLGQGACQALEDARALAKTLSASGDVPSALREYQEMRRRRAARLTIASRRIGRIAHLRAAPLRAVRDRAVAMVPARIRDRQIDSVVGRP